MSNNFINFTGANFTAPHSAAASGNASQPFASSAPDVPGPSSGDGQPLSLPPMSIPTDPHPGSSFRASSGGYTSINGFIPHRYGPTQTTYNYGHSAPLSGGNSLHVLDHNPMPVQDSFGQPTLPPIQPQDIPPSYAMTSSSSTPVSSGRGSSLVIDSAAPSFPQATLESHYESNDEEMAEREDASAAQEEPATEETTQQQQVEVVAGNGSRWTDQQVKALIASVKIKWGDLRGTRNNIQTGQVWTAIIGNYKSRCPEDQCQRENIQTKWRSLYAEFNDEVDAQNSTGEGVEDVPVTFRFYDDMLWLLNDDAVRPQAVTDNVNGTQLRADNPENDGNRPRQRQRFDIGEAFEQMTATNERLVNAIMERANGYEEQLRQVRKQEQAFLRELELQREQRSQQHQQLVSLFRVAFFGANGGPRNDELFGSPSTNLDGEATQQQQQQQQHEDSDFDITDLSQL